MSYTLTKRQREWLDSLHDLPKDKRTLLLNAFLAKGPAEVLNLMDLTTGEITYQAAIRGIRVEKPFEHYAEAEDFVEEKLEQYKQRAGTVTLDEIALGISDHNWRMLDALTEVDVQVKQILHLGSMLTGDRSPEALEDFIKSCTEIHPPEALKDLPGLLEMAKEYVEKDLDDMDFEDEDDRNEFLNANLEIDSELFQDYVRESGLYGFLVQAATPVPDFYDGDAYSSSWGHYRTEWFYGETYEEAVMKAIPWAEKLRETAKQRYLETTRA